MKRAQLTLLAWGALAAASGCGAPGVLEASGTVSSADSLVLETTVAAVGGSECRPMQVFAWTGGTSHGRPAFVAPGFRVALSSPDGVLTETCSPNSPVLGSSIELPSPRLARRAGILTFEPILSYRRFGFTPCRAGNDIAVEARGPSTLPRPTTTYLLTVPVAAECCPPGQTFCGGACVDTAVDEAHCGGCGLSCTGGTCGAGMCGCPAEFTTCVAQSGPPKTSCCRARNQCQPDGTCRTGDL